MKKMIYKGNNTKIEYIKVDVVIPTECCRNFDQLDAMIYDALSEGDYEICAVKCEGSDDEIPVSVWDPEDIISFDK